MTKAQEVYERVEALVASGTKKADAFRQVAEEFGQPFNSMRGSYYAYTRSIGQSAPRTRKRQTTTEDAIASAVTALNRAITSIDGEIEVAKTRAAEAKAEYEHLRDSAEERKAAIQAKIDALSA
jgi:predicted  nucleic acid-binding Zn-ribbon protein